MVRPSTLAVRKAESRGEGKIWSALPGRCPKRTRSGLYFTATAVPDDWIVAARTEHTGAQVTCWKRTLGSFTAPRATPQRLRGLCVGHAGRVVGGHPHQRRASRSPAKRRAVPAQCSRARRYVSSQKDRSRDLSGVERAMHAEYWMRPATPSAGSGRCRFAVAHREVKAARGGEAWPHLIRTHQSSEIRNTEHRASFAWLPR